MRGMRRGSHLAVSLLLFAGFSFAQSTPPNCTTGWDWRFALLSLIKTSLLPSTTQKSYNSLHQNPCAVAAYLEGVCFGGLFEIDPLPQGLHYTGPNAGQGNLCQCNTVVYSLVSACGGCQGGQWTLWSEWAFNCTSEELSSNSTYPYSIPAGTRVPHWAYLNVQADNWSATAAENTGDSPEGTPSATTGTPKSTSTSHAHSKSNTGQIAGGVVGGIAGIALLAAFIFWYLRHRRRRREAQPSPFMTDAPHVAEAFGLEDSDTFTPRKYYDPSDPTTFPTSIVSPSLTVIPTAPGSEQAHGDGAAALSRNRSEYSGLPLV
ncbi:hypothetical protein BGW80DRAFT_1258557 [Lactifluus volemus]|nr:hypothetical protein BGW80DRAFT_1258557 [Lactifluus volemus]